MYLACTRFSLPNYHTCTQKYRGLGVTAPAWILFCSYCIDMHSFQRVAYHFWHTIRPSAQPTLEKLWMRRGQKHIWNRSPQCWFDVWRWPLSAKRWLWLTAVLQHTNRLTTLYTSFWVFRPVCMLIHTDPLYCVRETLWLVSKTRKIIKITHQPYFQERLPPAPEADVANIVCSDVRHLTMRKYKVSQQTSPTTPQQTQTLITRFR